MVNGLKETQVTVLTWLVYALITILTFITGWQQVQIYQMPKEFVQLERYRDDSIRSDNTLCRIEEKLDRLIMGAREDRKRDN